MSAALRPGDAPAANAVGQSAAPEKEPAGASTTASPASAPAPATWVQIAERGSALGIWTMVLLARFFGRRVARFFVAFVVAYFVVVAYKARRASAAYLRRMGQPHGWGGVYRHCLRFAHCTLDRLFWVAGRGDLFEVTKEGPEHLVKLAAERRGAILLGAHLGSFEAMLGSSQRVGHPLNIVGYFRNAPLINGVLQRINPAATARLISVAPGVDFVLSLKERLDAGEMVAILADRVGLQERSVEVDFLGGKAHLPSGPFLLAAILRCPVYLTFGLYREPNHYHLICEPFADSVELPRKARDQAVKEYVQRYADRLAHHTRSTPDNWFNFYDYWRERT